MKFYASSEKLPDELEVEAVSLPEAIWKLSVSWAHRLSKEQSQQIKIKDSTGKLLACTDIEPVSFDIFRKLDQLGAIQIGEEFSFQNSVTLQQGIEKFKKAEANLRTERHDLIVQHEQRLEELDARLDFTLNHIEMMNKGVQRLARFASAAWLYSLSDCSTQILAQAQSVHLDRIHVCTDLLNGDKACWAAWRHPNSFGTSIASNLDVAFSHPVEIQCWRFESLNADKVYLRLGSGLIEFSFPSGFKFDSCGSQVLSPVMPFSNQSASFAVFLQGLFDRFSVFKGNLRVNLFQGKFAPVIQFFSYAYEPSAFSSLPTVEDSAIQQSRAYDFTFCQLGKVFGRTTQKTFSFQRVGERSKSELVSSATPIAIDQISKDELIALAFSPRMQMGNAERNFKVLWELLRIKISEADVAKSAITGLIEAFDCKDNLASILLIEKEVDLLRTRLINLGQIYPNQAFIPTEEQLLQIKKKCEARFKTNNKEEGSKEATDKKKRNRSRNCKKMKKSQKN